MDIEDMPAMSGNCQLNAVSYRNRRSSDVLNGDFDKTADELVELLHSLSDAEPPLVDLLRESPSSTFDDAKTNVFSSEEIAEAIDLFFDYFLSADNASFAAKTLLCVMYAPTRQLSESSGSRFLTDVRHPARRLLKTLYQAASELPPDIDIDTDPLYLAMLEIVTSLAEEFDGDERLLLRAYFDLCELMRN